jgi:hypothetical protein
MQQPEFPEFLFISIFVEEDCFSEDFVLSWPKTTVPLIISVKNIVKNLVFILLII